MNWQLISALLLVVPLIWYFLAADEATYFRQPLTIDTELAANFGEVRADHYHLGLDIRTGGRENLPVYAAADGFISRVLKSPTGYGNAIFISHWNGRTTVYGHLNRFNDNIERYVYKKQCKEKQWQQDITFPPGIFPLEKGDLIGYSGNTGTSTGPHLHFEIRNTKTGLVLNPLFNGFYLNDETPPVIQRLYWYNRAVSIYETTAHAIATTENRVLVNAPRIGLGIESFDSKAGLHFKLGIYKAEIFMDGLLQYRFVQDSFPANQTRYSNAGIDYMQLLNSKQTIQYLFTLPGNQLGAFTTAKGNGVLNLADQRPHQVKMVISDEAGNETSTSFKMQYHAPAYQSLAVPYKNYLLKPGLPGLIKENNIELQFDRFSFYDTVHFTLATASNAIAPIASDRIRLYNENVPVHDSFLVRLKTWLQPNDPLRQYTVMQLTNHKNRFIVKGNWKGSWMEGFFDRLGIVELKIDTIAPQIKLLNPADTPIRILCKDNLGAIASFQATIDGRWVPFEQKDNLFFYQPDKHWPSGPHHLQVNIKDIAGNTATQTFQIFK